MFPLLPDVTPVAVDTVTEREMAILTGLNRCLGVVAWSKALDPRLRWWERFESHLRHLQDARNRKEPLL